MAAVNALLEKLMDDRTLAVADAGAMLLGELSRGDLQPSVFIEDPMRLTAPPFLVPRYLAQVTLRALRGEYETLEELAGHLHVFQDRNPPTLEPGRQKLSERVLVPEARVVELRQPSRREGGHWESGIVAMVTSGALRGTEIDIRISSSENRNSCFLVSCLWIHAAISAYNLMPAGLNGFTACPETFFVIEPMRQINVTSVARSLHCTKPQLDQLRRGRGETTIQTLRGTVVHALFDRMLEGARDLEAMFDDIIPQYGVQLASIVDDFFDEGAFRSEVLRHLQALREFIDANPQILEDPQIELKRYSATLGIQGRIDALFRQGNRLDILELKTGSRIRTEDHAQLFIYRLLLSDLVRRWQRGSGAEMDISARLLSSTDGSFASLQIQTDFHQVMDARNRLIASHYAVSLPSPHFKFRYEGFNEDVCRPCPSWLRKQCKETTEVFGDRPGREESPRLAYFRRFTHLVEREHWVAEQDLADLLDDSRIEGRKKNFRCLVNVRPIADSNPFTFEFDENTSDLQPGDAVLIHSGNISSTPIYHGYVRQMETQRICVSIPLKNLSPAVFENQQWIIDRFPSDVTSEASHTALYDYLVSGTESNFAQNLRPASTWRDGVADQVPKIPGLFNASQIRAIQRAVTCSSFHLIWGPPGTGKTKVIPEIVRRSFGRVLLGAFTNTAVDKMLMALRADDPSVRFLRMGRASDSPELAALLPDPSDYFSEDLAQKHRSIHAIRRAMDAAPIVAATAHKACTMPYLRRRAFEMSIIDEAGQLTEPLTLGLTLRSRRFVLVGDDRQLPPVVRTRELTHSMFERLKRDAERDRTDNLTLLDTQYRMHPQIMAVSNKLFYDGRLRSGVSPEDRLPPEGAPVMMVPVNSVAEGRVNSAEAEAIVELVRYYRIDLRVPADAIGVVSPFRAQVVLLRKLLAQTGVSVDTVERFQGGERDIMILSLVRCQGGGFVFDERRLNVAITRARRKLVFVAHPDLFRNSKYEWISTFTETHRTAGTT
jgi:DNA replication ATP-dependent helicase Dna2